MNMRKLLSRMAFLAVLLVSLPALTVQADEWDYYTTMYENDYNYWPPFWGQQAPHLVYDGENYFAICASYSGLYSYVWKYDGYDWSAGFGFVNSYQTPLLLLDGENKLILVIPQSNDAPLVLRAYYSSDHNYFYNIQSPPVSNASYIGAAYYGNYLWLIHNYVDGGGNYDLVCSSTSLASIGWNVNTIHQGSSSERWLYPAIQIDGYSDVHVAVSNAPNDGYSHYNRTYYFKTGLYGGISEGPETVCGTYFNAWCSDILKAENGLLYFAVRQEDNNGDDYNLLVVRRNYADNYTQTAVASCGYYSDVMHIGLYQQPGSSRIYVPAVLDNYLYLYWSDDGGDSYPYYSYSAPGCYYGGYLSTVKQSAGGSMPYCPSFVWTDYVSGGGTVTYRLWMTQIGI